MKKLFSIGLLFVIGLIAIYGITAYRNTPQIRLVFTGDIMLSREVQHEIEQKHGLSPWSGIKDYFRQSDLVLGNLEGSIGDKKDCLKKDDPLCFATNQNYLHFIKEAGLNAIGVENNHSADLGEKGRNATISSLSELALKPITYIDAPVFFKSGPYVFGIIALNNIKGADGKMVEIPSPLLRQKIRLAKSLANWVIIYVHWGTELADWTQPRQRSMAVWLTNQGADLVIGSHPHVVESTECINGKPVFFSLGNHIFDQKYPETKEGLIAECTIKHDTLSCIGVRTHTPTGSSFPIIVTDQKLSAVLDKCQVKQHTPIRVNGYDLHPKLADHQFIGGTIMLEGVKDKTIAWDVIAKRVLSLEPAVFKIGNTSKEFLFSLEEHHSSIDKETSSRPYVYELSPHGPIAKWRGSALAWPLIDAQIIHSGKGKDYLCALHRKDSFIMLNPNSTATRTKVYQWNGFGFSGVSDKRINETCNKIF